MLCILSLVLGRPKAVRNSVEMMGKGGMGEGGKAAHHYDDCFTRRRTHNPRCARAIPLLMQIIIMLGTQKSGAPTEYYRASNAIALFGRISMPFVLVP